MRLLFALLATAIASVQAFSDTSPFLLLSSPLQPDSSRQTSSSVNLASRDYVFNTTNLILSECQSEIYFILTQPSSSEHKISNIIQELGEKEIDTRLSVSEAVGLQENDGEKIALYLEEKCNGKRSNSGASMDIERQRNEGQSTIVIQKFDRNVLGSDFSHFINELSQIKKKYKYSIILVTTPPKVVKDYQNSIKDLSDATTHTELKRSIQARAHKISADADLRPLFEKYQFLSPGLFVGIFVTVILIVILSVGVRAISSLEVSYGAFDKEIGPAGSKKQ
ncbi:hypothetical protein K3495_g4142 [Podosphaera aphanis]|nr:hypothetical protein K3495_g4142 [Podosphaera aphanis]